MFIIPLSLLIFGLSASGDPTIMVHKTFGHVHFLQSNERNSKSFIRGRGGVEDKNYKIPCNNYAVILKPNRELKNPDCIAIVQLENAYKGKNTIILTGLKNEDAQNLAFILNKRNFENNGRGSTATICNSVVQSIGAQVLIELCVNNKNIIRLEIDQVYSPEIGLPFSEMAPLLFDPGVQEYLKKNDNWKDDVPMVLFALVPKLQAYKNDGLCQYERFFTFLDDRFPYTKAFCDCRKNGPKEIGLTIRYSVKFRHNFFFYIILPLASTCILLVFLRKILS